MIQADADLIEVLMVMTSIGFMGFGAVYAYRLRNKITKAVLLIALSKNLYKNLAMVLGFAFAITVIHLVAHLVPYFSVPIIADLAIHLSLDLMLIMVSIALYSTFRGAYGLLQGSTAAREAERKMKKAL